MRCGSLFPMLEHRRCNRESDPAESKARFHFLAPSEAMQKLSENIEQRRGRISIDFLRPSPILKTKAGEEWVRCPDLKSRCPIGACRTTFA